MGIFLFFDPSKRFVQMHECAGNPRLPPDRTDWTFAQISESACPELLTKLLGKSSQAPGGRALQVDSLDEIIESERASILRAGAVEEVLIVRDLVALAALDDRRWSPVDFQFADEHHDLQRSLFARLGHVRLEKKKDPVLAPELLEVAGTIVTF